MVAGCDGGGDPADAIAWCVSNPQPVAMVVLDPGSGVAAAAEREWTDEDGDLTFGSFDDVESELSAGDSTDRAVALDAMRTRVPNAFAQACSIAFDDR
jgi:hypothetical protein